MLWNRTAFAPRVRLFVALSLLCALFVGLVALPTLARQTPQELVQKGDAYWSEKSYTLAAASYQRALLLDPKLPNRAEIELRVLVSKIKAAQWDAAVLLANEFVQRYKETPQEVRGQVWRGRLYSAIPHQGYRIGKKIVRGENAPKSEGGEAPAPVNLAAQDAQEALESFTRAKLLAQAFRRRGNLPPAEQRMVLDEEVYLAYDLANLHSQGVLRQEWTRALLFFQDWAIDLQQPYNPRWAAPKRVLYLYEQLPILDKMRPNSDGHDTVLAALGKGAFLMDLRRMYRYYNPYWYDSRTGAYRPRPRIAPIPYLQQDPIQILKDALKRHPSDRDADRLAYTIAKWTNEKGDRLEALRLYRAFLQDYPTSRWKRNAQYDIEDILRPALSLFSGGIKAPGQPAALSLSSRNIKLVRFTAYRIYLEEIFGKARRESTDDYRPDWHTILTEAMRKPNYRRDKIAEWTTATPDNGTCNDVSMQVPTPLDSLGAYFVEARVDGRAEVGANTIVLISDFALAQKLDRDTVLLYAAETKSGRPIADVNLTTWESGTEHDPQWKNARYFEGRTNSAGTAHIVLRSLAERKRPGKRIETFAQAGPNRYILTNYSVWYNYAPEMNRPDGKYYRLFVQTDRPLYRPKQKVNVRVAIMQNLPAKYRPAVGQKATLTVNSPKGEVLSKEITTGEFGTASANFDLPPGADLGQYTASVSLPLPENPFVGVGSFFVEEYKKPEFTVSVQPEKVQARVGENVKMTVSARYFFDAPVPFAKVSYKVFHAPYAYPIPFEPRLAWFSEEDPVDAYRRRYAPSPQLYRQGETTTDANGEATLVFPTKSGKQSPGDQRYTVTAEVADSSRRMVAGAGSIAALQTQFRAFMKFNRNFLLAGETLGVEVRTRDGNERPVGAKGRIQIMRLIPEVPERKERDPKTGKEIIVVKYQPPREEPAGVLFASANETGDAQTSWLPEREGNYRLDYETRDAEGNAVSVSANITVYGLGYDTTLNKDNRILTLQAEREEERPDEMARLLIVTPAPDCYVLLTEQAAGRIVGYRTLFVSGRSAIIPVAIRREVAPNVSFNATAIHEGVFYSQEVSIGVPLESRILSVRVTPDKPTYQPGSQATFALEAKDANGKPVQGEFSLSVVDASLLAIQPDVTPDIRRLFYGFRIQTFITSDSSFYYSPGDYAYPFSYPRESVVELLYPEGMGYLQDDLQQKRSLPNYEPAPALQELDEARKSRFNLRGRGFGGGMGGMQGEMEPGRRPGGTGGFFPAASGADSDGAMVTNGSFFAKKDANFGMRDAPSEPAGALVEATVRRLFADSAFWSPSVVTDAQGRAAVTFTMPDNITQWKVAAIGNAADAKVGTTTTETVTKKNLMARLQAPRFFVERDQVTLSANIHNYLETTKNVRVELLLDNERIALTPGSDSAGNEAVRQITLGKGEEKRVDWTVGVKQAGLTKIKVVAQTDQESDAAEMEFPVLVHGVEKFLAQSGVLRNGGTAQLTLSLPELRQLGASRLHIQMQPSLAMMLLDALPYLEDYPYGCLEQTLSRFAPSVLVAKALREAGTDLETVGKRMKEREEQRNKLPPQQVYANSGYTYPKGIPGALNAQELASRIASPSGRRSNRPVFSSAALNAMVNEGLERLYKWQRGNGGWGWWEGSASEDVYLSAFVYQYLILAKQADVPVRQEALDRAARYLTARRKETEELHLKAYLHYVLSLPYVGSKVELDAETGAANDFLYARRDRLNAYGKAMLALTLHVYGDRTRPPVLMRNLLDSAQRDLERGTVHWKSDDRMHWRWYNDKLETTAMVLRALTQVGSPQEVALAPQVVRWLTDNRRGGFWTATRQTANVIEALLQYARTQQELTPDYAVTVEVDGKIRREFQINRENALFAENRFIVGDEILQSGGNAVTITMRGTGTLYYNAYLSYFDKQEPITGVSNAIGVERKYYKIVAKAPTNKRGAPSVKEERIPLQDGAQLTSGDIIEAELYLKSDNDYDYLVFEDMKPAGCEPLETRSGVAYGDGLCSNFELRDEKVAFFIDALPQGTRRLTYRLRAEIPGAFHALPTNAYAFYTPDIRALSNEFRLNIVDAPPKPPRKR